jgi:hypothetical protein
MLNFESEKEFEMKKILIWGLMLLITATSTIVTSCNQEDEEVPKVIEEKYRGTFMDQYGNKRTLTENKYISHGNFGNPDSSFPAWTENTDLYVKWSDDNTQKYGYFIDNDTYKPHGDDLMNTIYKRQ